MLIMHALEGAFAFNVEKVEILMIPPVVHEQRDNIKIQNWVILSAKWISEYLISLTNDMQRYMRQLAEY